MSKTLHPTCPDCGGAEFEVRALKDEGVAAVRCVSCSRHYLVLDSGDYWFDVIQRGYPRARRCSCKGEAFRLTFDYGFRETGDVEWVAIRTTCSTCGKTRQLMTVEIDYGPTERLVERPLTYCRNPKILYDLKSLTLYAKRADIARIAEHLAAEARATFVGRLREKGRWVLRPIDLAAVRAAILHDGGLGGPESYFWIYALLCPIAVSEEEVGAAKSEDAFWKRHEIIRLSSPTHMMLGSKTALLYYVQFSNEYVEGEQVISKSPEFHRQTAKFLDWLGRQFVTWRGPGCFDNPDEHVRVFGKRFRPKKR